MLAGFSTDFLNLFQASPILSAAKLSINDTPVLEDPDGWADLEEESHSHGQAKLHLIVKEDVGGPIPEISTLPRPEELTKRPPYWLVVKQEGLGKVVVQGSHTASLTCLEEYLKRWRRGAADRANRVSTFVEYQCQLLMNHDAAACRRSQIAGIVIRTWGDE